jgi:hypothetical protein
MQQVSVQRRPLPNAYLPVCDTGAKRRNRWNANIIERDRERTVLPTRTKARMVVMEKKMMTAANTPRRAMSLKGVR